MGLLVFFTTSFFIRWFCFFIIFHFPESVLCWSFRLLVILPKKIVMVVYILRSRIYYWCHFIYCRLFLFYHARLIVFGSLFVAVEAVRFMSVRLYRYTLSLTYAATFFRQFGIDYGLTNLLTRYFHWHPTKPLWIIKWLSLILVRDTAGCC